MEPDSAARLTGNVYRGTDAQRPVRPFVVIKDTGGESVTVENADPPHATRRILRRRLLSYKYELIGRRADNGRPVEHWAPPPTFNGPGFASWLRRWMAAEGIAVVELAKRAGVSVGAIHVLRRGVPADNVRVRKGQDALHPAIESIAAVAHGLGLQFSYVASKAGFGDTAGRWANFTETERIALAIALGGESDDDDLEALLEEAVQPIQKEPVS